MHHTNTTQHTPQTDIYNGAYSTSSSSSSRLGRCSVASFLRLGCSSAVRRHTLYLLIVVLPDANASVCYGKQVKWLSMLVVFVGYFFYALLLKHYLRHFYHAGRIKRLCETELVVITVLQ
jgi:hypothetical protein